MAQALLKPATLGHIFRHQSYQTLFPANMLLSRAIRKSFTTLHPSLRQIKLKPRLRSYSIPVSVLVVGSIYKLAQHTSVRCEGARVVSDTKLISPANKDAIESLLEHILATLRRIWRIAHRVLFMSVLFVPPLLFSPAIYMAHTVAPTNTEWVLRRWWAWLRWSCETSGPTLIKLAQWASMRTDRFPEMFCTEFSKLHDGSSQHSWSQTNATLCDALGHAWRDRLSLDTAPVGSGCVAQVYRGTFKESADAPAIDVAVKVLHPAIKQSIQDDISILKIVTNLIDALPLMKYLALPQALEEFEHLITTQLDLTIEAENYDRFRQNFHSDARVSFPKPIEAHHTVLVETFAAGVPVNHVLEHASKEICQKVGEIICDLYLKMLFQHNFSHGDMHPGNIFVTGSESVHTVGVTLLDVGIVTELGKVDQRNFTDLFRAIAKRDGRLAGRLILENSRNKSCESPEVFIDGVAALVDEALSAGLSLEELKVGQLLASMMKLSCSNRVGLETNFVSVACAIMVLEALGRSLNPHQDILMAATPYLIRRAVRETFS
eukprot:m.154320 g.154320  ORF g.154320 m.154320 type:complete len:548 (-) comp30883_c0_seq2:56-1699(-)